MNSQRITVTVACPDCDGTGGVLNKDTCTLDKDNPYYFNGACPDCPQHKVGDCSILPCKRCNGRGYWKYSSDYYRIIIERDAEIYGPELRS